MNPHLNLGFVKGGGLGGEYDESGAWVDVQNPSSYPGLEGEQNIIQDGKDMDYITLGNYCEASVSPESALDTAAQTPDREFCPDLPIVPCLTIGMSGIDFQGMGALAGFDGSLLVPSQYQSSIEDFALQSMHGSSMMLTGNYNPGTQSIDTSLTTTLMPMGSGGGGFPRDNVVSARPSNGDKNNTFQHPNDAETPKENNVIIPKKPKDEELPTSSFALATSESEASPAKVEEAEESVQSKDKTDVPQKKRKRSQKGSVCEDSTEELLFACPLYRKYPLQNMDCVNRKLTRIRDVKQHLLRRHLAYRCPICKISLPSDARKDEHIQEQNCTHVESSERFGPDGITQEVHDILKQKSHRGKAPTTKWYEVWEIIFGDTKREEDPFLGPMMDETARLMRDVWKKEQQSIVKDVISEANGVRDPAEQQMKVMLDMFERVQDRFEARILELTHRETSSERSSPLMAPNQTLTKIKNTTTNKLITEAPRNISHLPEGGDDRKEPQVYVQSGTNSLSADSGDQADNYTLSSPSDPRYGAATPRLKSSNTRTNKQLTSYDDVTIIERTFASSCQVKSR